MNTQNEDINDMDRYLSKDRVKTPPSEATEETKKGRGGGFQKNHNHNINFKGSLQDHNIGLILILTGLKTTYLQGRLVFSKGYSLNVFQIKKIRISLLFLFQFDL